MIGQNLLLQIRKTLMKHVESEIKDYMNIRGRFSEPKQSKH